MKEIPICATDCPWQEICEIVLSLAKKGHYVDIEIECPVSVDALYEHWRSLFAPNLNAKWVSQMRRIISNGG